MKKTTIGIISALVLLVVGAIAIIGFGAKDNTELATLYDKYTGYETTIEYPKDANITITEDSTDNIPSLTLKDGDFTIEMSYDLGRAYNNQKERDSKDSKVFKEFQAGDLEGFYAVDSSNRGKALVLIHQQDGTFFEQDCLVLNIENPQDKEAISEYLESNKFTKMLGSIKFTDKDVPEYQGAISNDRSFGINAKTPEGYQIAYGHLNSNEVRVLLYQDGEEADDSNDLINVTVTRYIGAKASTASDLANKQLADNKYGSYNPEVTTENFGDHTVYTLSYAKNEKRFYGAVELDGVLYTLDINLLNLEDGDADLMLAFLTNLLDGVYNTDAPTEN